MNVQLDAPTYPYESEWLVDFSLAVERRYALRELSDEMPKPTGKTCPSCGATVPNYDQELPPTGSNQIAAEDREYDHRGILLPGRSRIGGIIIPQ